MAFDVETFRALAQQETELNVNLPEVTDALNRGYLRLLNGGEVTESRVRDYLMGFRDGRQCAQTEIAYARMPHDVRSE